MVRNPAFRGGDYHKHVTMGKRTIKEGECCAIWDDTGKVQDPLVTLVTLLPWIAWLPWLPDISLLVLLIANPPGGTAEGVGVEVNGEIPGSTLCGPAAVPGY